MASILYIGGPQYQPQHSTVLIMGTLKLWNPPILGVHVGLGEVRWILKILLDPKYLTVYLGNYGILVYYGHAGFCNINSLRASVR